jgi:peptidoglycan DL-endopeptidase CwlO
MSRHDIQPVIAAPGSGPHQVTPPSPPDSHRSLSVRLASRRCTQRLRVRGLAATVVGLSRTALFWTPGTDGAQAKPRPSVAEAARQVEELNHDAEQAAERYNATQERIKSLNVRLKAAQTRLDRARRDLDAARRALAVVIVQEYKDGDLSTAKLVLSDSPDALLQSGAVLASLGERRAEAAANLAARQKALQDLTADLTNQQQKLVQAQVQLDTSAREVKAKLASARRVLDGLQSAERVRLAQQQSLRSILGRKVPDHPSCAQAGIDPSAFSSRVRKVITYLCAHLGDPYVWAAAGPNAFDCSGLSQQAWLQAGVSLPHNADMQSHYGTPVAAGGLRPGDLVFFYRPITHMGIYVGNGLMIAAPRTGDVVKIRPVNYKNLTAATRL